MALSCNATAIHVALVTLIVVFVSLLIVNNRSPLDDEEELIDSSIAETERQIDETRAHVEALGHETETERSEDATMLEVQQDLSRITESLGHFSDAEEEDEEDEEATNSHEEQEMEEEHIIDQQKMEVEQLMKNLNQSMNELRTAASGLTGATQQNNTSNTRQNTAGNTQQNTTSDTQQNTTSNTQQKTTSNAQQETASNTQQDATSST